MSAADPTVDRLLEQIRQRHDLLPALPVEAAGPDPPEPVAMAAASPIGPSAALARKLEAFGLLPAYAQHVAQHAGQLLRPDSTTTPVEELAAVAAVLSSAWRSSPRATRSPWHVLIGAPGSGKTTCLCKWLAQSTLLADCTARVWRLDGVTANTAEALSVFAEAFGVPVNRCWPGEGTVDEADVHFVDLPGVNWRDSGSMEALAERLVELPGAQIHLVLNAAYELPRLFEQVDAFSQLPLADLIFSHLDEEPRWGRLWNFVLGTPVALGFLSAGQNVPGEFYAAAPEVLLPRSLPEIALG